MKTFRALRRLLFFIFYTLYNIGRIVCANVIFGADPQRSIRIRQRWARGLLPGLGIQVHVQGTPPDFPCIVAANHRSNIDPALMAHDVNGFGVAKAEVADWPLIGWGARVAGVLFLKRESRDSRKVTLNGIAEKIKEGFPVIIFVEGTTHGGTTTMEFKPGSFKLAAEQHFPVVPVAIEFRAPEDYWTGDDTFLPHLWRRLKVKNRDAYIHYGPTLQNNDPDILMREAKEWIDAELLQIRKGF